MTFVKYTNDGKAVIQPAALVLSGLENEDALEMHTLNNVIVLLKEEMPPVEKVETVCSLMRLVNSLTADLMCGFDECDDEDAEGDEDDEDDESCEDTDTIPIPIEALMEAGIWGEDLRVQVVTGAVIITEDVDDD